MNGPDTPTPRPSDAERSGPTPETGPKLERDARFDEATVNALKGSAIWEGPQHTDQVDLIGYLGTHEGRHYFSTGEEGPNMPVPLDEVRFSQERTAEIKAAGVDLDTLAEPAENPEPMSREKIEEAVRNEMPLIGEEHRKVEVEFRLKQAQEQERERRDKGMDEAREKLRTPDAPKPPDTEPHERTARPTPAPDQGVERAAREEKLLDDAVQHDPVAEQPAAKAKLREYAEEWQKVTVLEDLRQRQEQGISHWSERRRQSEEAQAFHNLPELTRDMVRQAVEMMRDERDARIESKLDHATQERLIRERSRIVERLMREQAGEGEVVGIEAYRRSHGEYLKMFRADPNGERRRSDDPDRTYGEYGHDVLDRYKRWGKKAVDVLWGKSWKGRIFRGVLIAGAIAGGAVTAPVLGFAAGAAGTMFGLGGVTIAAGAAAAEGIGFAKFAAQKKWREWRGTNQPTLH